MIDFYNNVLVEKAKEFSKQAHESINQKRKHSGEPYYLHPWRVAEILQKLYFPEKVIIVAYLHDILEDVKTESFSIDKINLEFGFEITEMVIALTHMFTKEAFPFDNRKTRKFWEAKRLEQFQDYNIHSIKLADIIDNLRSPISENGWGESLLNEFGFLISVLNYGNTELINLANKELKNARNLSKNF